MKKSIRVFIVEDALFLKEMLCHIFVEAGIEVVGVANSGGEETLSRIKKLNPDIVLTDLVLPEKNGITLIHEISDTVPDTKVIVCSSLPQELFKTQSEIAGAFDFIEKPFSSDEIVEAVFTMFQTQTEEPRSKVA